MDTAEISTSTKLKEVKKLLGKDYRKVLSEATGFSISRVSQVFRDEDLSHPILKEAIVRALRIKEKNEATSNSLQSL